VRILLLTQYYPPESGSSAMRMAELAAHFVSRGHRVTVVTGFPNYPDGVIFPGYRGKLWQLEQIDGVRVLRTYLLTTPRRDSFRHRLLNYVSFMVTSVFGGMAAGHHDLIYFYSPPLFLGVSAWILSRFYGIPSVVEVNDLWPQAAVALGVLRQRPLIRLAEMLERFVYDTVDEIFVYSYVMREALLERGVPHEKIELRPLWVDTDLFQPCSPVETDAVRKEHGLADRCVVMYAGNIGLAQGMDTVIDCADLLRAHTEIVFALVGEGAEKAALRRAARDRGLTNVAFVPYQPVTVISRFLSSADILLVHLDPAPHRLGTIPAKALAYMSVGRPVLMAAEGESAALVTQCRCGVVIKPRDPAAMAEAILQMCADCDAREEWGRNGRRSVQESYDRAALLQSLESRLEEIALT
jgi:colanic acid biosynthesis glycosyl transferase WcaI